MMVHFITNGGRVKEEMRCQYRLIILLNYQQMDIVCEYSQFEYRMAPMTSHSGKSELSLWFDAVQTAWSFFGHLMSVP